MAIRQTLSHSRLTWRLAALLLAALICLPAVALAQSPPAAPSSVTLTRADGTLTASWPEVSGAAKYHVTYTSDNTQSWTAAPCGDNCTVSNNGIAINEGVVSITITGADNGKPYVVGVRAGNDNSQWSGWRNSDSIAPLTPPPATPASVSVTRADGTLTVSGYSVSNADKYHVTYSSNGGNSWTSAADNHTGTSITISGADNAKTYVVGVRAGNAGGWSGWRNSPASGPYTPTPTPEPEPPAAPASITVTRSDGAITANWPAVAGADSYAVAYSAVGGGNWTTAASKHAKTSITIAGVNNDHTYVVSASAQNRAGKSPPRVSPPAGPYAQRPPDAPPSVTILRADGKITAFWNSGWGAESYHVTYTADGGRTWHLAAASHPVGHGITSIDISNVDNGKTYTVGVRARNKNGYSGWRNSAPSGSYVRINPPPKPKNVSAYPSDGAVTFIWDKPVDLINTEVTGYQAAYWENPGNCAWPDTVRWYNIYGSDGNMVYYTIPNLKNGVKYGVALRAHNQYVPGPGEAGCRTPVAGVKPPPNLPSAPTNLTVTRGNGKLTVSWYHVPTAINYDIRYSVDGGRNWNWEAFYYATTTRIMGGMDDTANYIVSVRARNKRGEGPWTNSGVIGLTVSNLAQTAYAYDCPVASNRKCAVAFTTGGAVNGYTLAAVTAKFANQSDTHGQLGDVVVTLHAESSGGGNVNSNGNASSSNNSTFPADDALATLNGNNPDTAGDYTYTCSGDGCALSANTTYFVQFGAASGTFTSAFYNLKATASDAETLVPGGNGWSLANAMKTFDGASWSTPNTGETGLLQVSALTEPALTAGSVTSTGATLTITGHGVKWWYQANKAPDNRCLGPVRRSNTQALTGLSASTTYTYRAYSAAGCAIVLDNVTFTTVTPGGRDSSKDITLASGNNRPYGIWSDGTTMWVAQQHGSKIFAYNLSSKARDAAKDISRDSSAHTYLESLTSNGVTMWVSDLLTFDKLFAYSVSGKSYDSAKNLTLHTDNGAPGAPWTDGVTIWVTDTVDKKLYAYTLSSGARDSSKDITLHTDNANPEGLWANDKTMWVSDHADDKVYAYKLSDGSRDSAKDYNSLDSNHTEARGIWSDGTTMWIANLVTTNPKIYAYHVVAPHSQASGGARASSRASNARTASVVVAAATVRGTKSPVNPAGTAAQAANRAGNAANAHQGSGRGEAATASATSPPGHVTNLTSVQSGDSDVDAAQRQSVAFTTGPNPGGYTLKSFTAALRKVSGDADLVLTLHDMASDAYGDDSQPSTAVLATLSGSAPASGAFADVTYTCSGEGCDLQPDTTYFVVAQSSGSGAYAWAYVASANLYTESTVPADSGWTLGASHYAQDGVEWASFGDWHHARVDFETHPVLSVGNLAEAPHPDACFPSGDTRCAVGFTTGDAAGGYTLRALTARFEDADDPDGNLGDLVVTLHEDNAGLPGQALATLSGDNPTEAGDYTYTCAGAGCALKPDTTYFVQMTAAAGAYLSEAYEWSATLSDHETAVPSGNGWTLANGTTAYHSTWQTYPDVGLMAIVATP